MKKFLFVAVGLLFGYGGVAGLLSLLASRNEAKFHQQLTRLAALGDATGLALGIDVIPGLEGVTSIGDHPLREACAALRDVDPLQMLAYFPAPHPEVMAGLPKDARFPTRELVGMDAKRFDTAYVQAPWRDGGVQRFLADILGDTPDRWGYRMNRFSEPFNHSLDGVKYLLVHRIVHIKVPEPLGSSYLPGSMTFRSAVLDAATGAELCRGNSLVRQTGEMFVAGQGKSQAEAEANAAERAALQVTNMLLIETQTFGLGQLCSLGGAALCKATLYPFDAKP